MSQDAWTFSANRSEGGRPFFILANFPNSKHLGENQFILHCRRLHEYNVSKNVAQHLYSYEHNVGCLSNLCEWGQDVFVPMMSSDRVRPAAKIQALIHHERRLTLLTKVHTQAHYPHTTHTQVPCLSTAGLSVATWTSAAREPHTVLTCG